MSWSFRAVLGIILFSFNYLLNDYLPGLFPGKGLVAWSYCILHLTLNDNVVSSAYMSTVDLSSKEIGYAPGMSPEVPLVWQGVDLKNTGIHSLSKLTLSFKIWLKPHHTTFQYLKISILRNLFLNCFCIYRGNNVTDMKEIGKLKCLPLLRALLLMGKQTILTDFVILYYVHLYE